MNTLKIGAAALFASAAIPSFVLAQGMLPTVEMEGSLEYGKGNGGIGVTMPLLLDASRYMFLEGRAGIDVDAAPYGSLGLGYRWRRDDLVFGVYGYYDATETVYHNGFHQLSFGAEAIGRIFEARANAYLPLNDSAVAEEFNRAFVDGEELLFQSGREEARGGMDAEIGARLPVFPENAAAQFKLFGGGYWYEGDRVDDTLGVRGRAELQLAGLPGVNPDVVLGLGASVSYDNEDDLEFGFRARLRVPLGGSGNTPAAFDPLTQPVERERRIRTRAGSDGDIEAAQFVSSGALVGKVVQLDETSGGATGINDELGAAGENALALINGEIALTQALLVGSGQHLLGGGGTIAVRGANSGQQATFANSGSAAVLTGTDSSANVIEMASGSEVASVSTIGGLAGIHASGASDILIRSVDISAPSADGIRLEDVANATIEASIIHDLPICEDNTACEFAVERPGEAPNAAISVQGAEGLTIRDTVMDAVTYGIFAGSRIDDSDWPPVITTQASDIVIDNVAITNSRREGILLVAAKGVTMNDVTIDNSAMDRSMDLVVLQGTSDVTITDMSLWGGTNGLMLISSTTLPEEAVTTNVRVDGLNIYDPARSGIFLNPVSDIRFDNVRIVDAGSYGVFAYGDAWGFAGGPITNVDFGRMSIENAAEAGIYFTGPVENIAGDVTVTNTAEECIAMMGELTQEDGSVLNLNGSPLTAANLTTRCPMF